MCGRFNLKSSPELDTLTNELGVNVKLEDQFNIAPTEAIPIVHNFEGKRCIHLAKWWFTPHWAKEPDTKYSMFNARSESIETSRAFKGSFRHKRCVIPCSSFIEWKKIPAENSIGKQAVELYSPKRALALAGLWDLWGGELLSCTILTTQASEEIQDIHSRMPVMLDKNGIQLWLSDTQHTDELKPLFTSETPYPVDHHPISSEINNSRNKSIPIRL